MNGKWGEGLKDQVCLPLFRHVASTARLPECPGRSEGKGGEGKGGGSPAEVIVSTQIP